MEAQGFAAGWAAFQAEELLRRDPDQRRSQGRHQTLLKNDLWLRCVFQVPTMSLLTVLAPPKINKQLSCSGQTQGLGNVNLPSRCKNKQDPESQKTA